jgi:hypothetical protein
VFNIPTVIIPVSNNKNLDNNDENDINDDEITGKLEKNEEKYESFFIIVEWNKFVIGKSQNIKIPKIKKEFTELEIEQRKIESGKKNKSNLAVLLNILGRNRNIKKTAAVPPISKEEADKLQKELIEKKRIELINNQTLSMNFKILFTIPNDENYLESDSELHFYLFGKRNNKDVIKLGEMNLKKNGLFEIFGSEYAVEKSYNLKNEVRADSNENEKKINEKKINENNDNDKNNKNNGKKSKALIDKDTKMNKKEEKKENSDSGNGIIITLRGGKENSRKKEENYLFIYGININIYNFIESDLNSDVHLCMTIKWNDVYIGSTKFMLLSQLSKLKEKNLKDKNSISVENNTDIKTKNEGIDKLDFNDTVLWDGQVFYVPLPTPAILPTNPNLSRKSIVSRKSIASQKPKVPVPVNMEENNLKEKNDIQNNTKNIQNTKNVEALDEFPVEVIDCLEIEVFGYFPSTTTNTNNIPKINEKNNNFNFAENNIQNEKNIKLIQKSSKSYGKMKLEGEALKNFFSPTFNLSSSENSKNSIDLDPNKLLKKQIFPINLEKNPIVEGGFFSRAKIEKKIGIEVVDVCIGTLALPVDDSDNGNRKEGVVDDDDELGDDDDDSDIDKERNSSNIYTPIQFQEACEMYSLGRLFPTELITSPEIRSLQETLKELSSKGIVNIYIYMYTYMCISFPFICEYIHLHI